MSLVDVLLDVPLLDVVAMSVRLLGVEGRAELVPGIDLAGFRRPDLRSKRLLPFLDVKLHMLLVSVSVAVALLLLFLFFSK